MEITACPKCGSRKIFQGRLKEGVLSGYTDRYVCRNCGYRGFPLIFDDIEQYKRFIEGKEGKIIEEIEETKSKDEKDISNSEKEVQEFLNEIKEEINNEDLNAPEKKSKFLKNTCATLGIVLLVTGILLVASNSLLFGVPLWLIADGIIILIIGLIGPNEEKLQDKKYLKKSASIPKIAGVLMIINAILNSLFYVLMMFIITFIELVPKDLMTEDMLINFYIIEQYQTLVLAIIGIWIIFCIFLLFGGIFSLIKKRWGIAILGAIFGTFLVPIYFYIPNIISIICLILIAYSRYVFKN